MKTSTPRGRSRDTIVLACAISAGVHAGLVPAHLRESGRLAAAFAVAAALAALIALAVSRWRRRRWGLAAAAGLLFGLLAAYALSRTAGIPALGAEREAIDPLGAATAAVEAIGLTTAAWLLIKHNGPGRTVVAAPPIQGGSHP